MPKGTFFKIKNGLYLSNGLVIRQHFKEVLWGFEWVKSSILEHLGTIPPKRNLLDFLLEQYIRAWMVTFILFLCLHKNLITIVNFLSIASVFLSIFFVFCSSFFSIFYWRSTPSSSSAFSNVYSWLINPVQVRHTQWETDMWEENGEGMGVRMRSCLVPHSVLFEMRWVDGF